MALRQSSGTFKNNSDKNNKSKNERNHVITIPQFDAMPLPTPTHLKLFSTYYLYSFALLLSLGI